MRYSTQGEGSNNSEGIEGIMLFVKMFWTELLPSP